MISRCIKLVLGTVLLGLVTLPALAAEPIAGADHPDFKRAVEAWLDDNDEVSLPLLHDLAISGSTAARLLLSQIDREMPSAGETDYMRSLSRKERRGLMRAPDKSVFGKSWIRHLSDEGDQLAKVLVNSKDVTKYETVLEPLMDAGEPQLAARISMQNSVQFPDAFMKIAGRPTFPDESRFTEWSAVSLHRFPDLNSNLKHGDMYAVLFLYQHRDWFKRKLPDRLIKTGEGLMLFQPYLYPIPDEESLSLAADIIAFESLRRPNLSPLARQCSAFCPDDFSLCMLQIARLAGGIHYLTLLDTPLENLIPQADYLSSRRAERTLFRQAARRYFEYSEDKRITDVPACIGNQFVDYHTRKR